MIGNEASTESPWRVRALDTEVVLRACIPLVFHSVYINFMLQGSAAF